MQALAAPLRHLLLSRSILPALVVSVLCSDSQALHSLSLIHI